MRKKGGVSDFEHGVGVGARQAGCSGLKKMVRKRENIKSAAVLCV